MNWHVFLPSSALVVLGLYGLVFSPGCHRPIEIQKGDYLLHATPEPAPPAKTDSKSRPIAPPDPDYHPE
jgi:hypothetical protein